MTKNPVWDPPIILAVTRRAPPITLHPSRPGRDPPNVVLKREAMTKGAKVRQGDTSHSVVRRNDSPQEVRTLTQDIMRNAQAAHVLGFNFLVAFLHFTT